MTTHAPSILIKLNIPNRTPSPLRSLRPCMGEGASLGEEAVSADSGRAGEVAAWVGRGEKSGLFAHPVGDSPVILDVRSSNFHRTAIVFSRPASQ